MKIIVLGAGQVGCTVVESLVSEANDLTVVDTDASRLAKLSAHHDLRTVVGNGALPSVLGMAGAGSADLLIAVTQSDETNLVACKVAASQFKIPRRLARLRAADYHEHAQALVRECFAVDHGICPEQAVTDYVAKLVAFPEALQVLEFAHGRVSLVAVQALKGGPLVGHRLRDMRTHMPHIDARVAAIYRGDQPLIPQGDTAIQPGDEVFFVAATEHIRRVMRELRQTDRPINRILLAGGGNIGMRLASHLEKHYSLKVIEYNKRRAQYLSSALKQTLVLQGDATDEELLAEENVEEADVFLAMTNDDETNIMSSLLAKRMGARRVVALINRHAYANLLEGLQIDIAISPAQASMGDLLAFVRKGDVPVVHSLRRGAAEALEIVLHGNWRSCQAIGRRIEELDLPYGVTIGAIVRALPGSGENGGGEVVMPHHDTVIQADDHLIVFVINKKLIVRMEKLFQSE